MDKFEWFPSECAPANYPVEILKGNFMFKNGGGIYIPDNRVIANGWGNVGSIHIAGEDFKPIPSNLEIIWFSYFEDKFYAGFFDLPYEEILNRFEEGYVSPIDDQIKTYNRITAGLAPGGMVSIWLMGEQITTEICAFFAEKVDLPWEKFRIDPILSRQELIQKRLEQVFSKKEIYDIGRENIPFGLWDEYRKRYSWGLNLVGNITPVNISIDFFNGERYYYNYQSKLGDLTNEMTMPKRMLVKYRILGIDKSAEIIFNETEIFSAFKTLTKGLEDKKVKLQIEINSINRSLKLFFRDDEYIIELQKSEVVNYK